MIDFEVTYPKITTERVRDVNIGRLDLPIRPMHSWVMNEVVCKFMNNLNGLGEESEKFRRVVSNNLSNNSPTLTESIAHQAGVSAYFTYNPRTSMLIVEWGTINPESQERKLHTYLRESINYNVRSKFGMKLSSGHMAPVTGAREHLALIDSLSYKDSNAQRGTPMGEIINALHAYGFIPITSDGYVQLPTFV